MTNPYHKVPEEIVTPETQLRALHEANADLRFELEDQKEWLKNSHAETYNAKKMNWFLLVVVILLAGAFVVSIVKRHDAAPQAAPVLPETTATMANGQESQHMCAAFCEGAGRRVHRIIGEPQLGEIRGVRCVCN